jgi:hypothetical protein
MNWVVLYKSLNYIAALLLHKTLWRTAYIDNSTDSQYGVR